MSSSVYSSIDRIVKTYCLGFQKNISSGIRTNGLPIKFHLAINGQPGDVYVIRPECYAAFCREMDFLAATEKVTVVITPYLFKKL